MDLEKYSSSQAHAPKSFVDNSVSIKGDLNFSETLEIQGSVVGNIFSDSNSISFLIIGKESEITGDITSSHVVVSGKVVGNILAQHIEIEQSARIVGVINYKSIEVHSGAKIDGSMTMSDVNINHILSSDQLNSISKPNSQNVSNQPDSTITLTKIPSQQIEVTV